MFLGPLGPVRAPCLHPQAGSSEPSFTQDALGVGVCFWVINISLLTYLHIYYKAKKVSKETRLARRIQCFGGLLAGRAGVLALWEGSGRLPCRLVLKRKREECSGAAPPAAAVTLGAGRLDRGTGVRRDVAVLVGGLVQVQRLLVDLERHAAVVESRDWR